MNNCKVTINARDLRRAAFVVGFGLTVGKAVGKLVVAAIDGTITGITKGMAAAGNKTAQCTCDNMGLKYEKKTETDEK